MGMSDPIGDLLTHIRNANLARHATATIPASRIKEDICKVLLREGFIENVERVEEGPQGKLKVTMKYTDDDERVIHGLQRVSRPSLRVFAKKDGLQQVRSGLGVAIVTTSRGVMTEKDARNAGIGGEVLCKVW